jgi:hypothetical protein
VSLLELDEFGDDPCDPGLGRKIRLAAPSRPETSDRVCGIGSVGYVPAESKSSCDGADGLRPDSFSS